MGDWFVAGSPSNKFSLCVVRATTLLLLCAGAVQLTTISDKMTPMLLMFWSSNHFNHILPESIHKNNGYLMVSANGELNQMRTGICDMVAIAKYLNVTLVVPQLDNTSLWHDSEFKDIFDVNYFIKSLRDEVRILKRLPDEQRRRIENAPIYFVECNRWSNMGDYYNMILPQIKEHEDLQFIEFDFRLANNEIPEELQKLRCRANFDALRFTAPIEEIGKKIVRILRQKGPFLALNLRYEMDLIAFTGCNEGCNETEVDELTKMRYATPWWEVKVINSRKKREAGGCPLTPEETAIALRALDIDPSIQIYIAAGNIYGGERRMAALKNAFPNLIKKETLLTTSDLEPFLKDSNMMAALDYLVSLESDIFVPTYGGNMAMLVEGHRRYLGFKMTLRLDRWFLVYLTDQYKNRALNSWGKFSNEVKTGHTNRMGSPTRWTEILERPMPEDYFYSNPQECLPPVT